jgi:hypothetical protein
MLDAEKSRRDMLLERGVDARVVPQHDVLEGINIVRKMLGRTWIDPIRDDRLQDWKPSEHKDWTNHGCDALRTFAAGFDEPPPPRPAERRWQRNDVGGERMGVIDVSAYTKSEPISVSLPNGATAAGRLWMLSSRRGSFQVEYRGKRKFDGRTDYRSLAHMRCIGRLILREMAEEDENDPRAFNPWYVASCGTT